VPLTTGSHSAWLRELSGVYDLIWATTWEHDANKHIAPRLGLPPLPVVEFSAYRPRPDDPRLVRCGTAAQASADCGRQT